MPDGLRLALTTLTVARVHGPERIDRQTAGSMMSLAPLIGLLVGAVAAAALFALQHLSFGDLLPAVSAVVVLALLTRGLHLDGLCDTADGLASYRPPQQALAVMRDPGVGALGAVTLVMVVLVQVAAISDCQASGRGFASVVLAAAVGRLAATAACTPPTPAASPDGLGALVAGTVRRGSAIAWAAVLVVAFSCYEALDDAVNDGTRVVNALRVVLAVTLALAVARVLRRHCVRRLGGINGDVLGALIEVTTLVVLVVMSLELPSGLRP